MSVDQKTDSAHARFATTQWRVVLAARRGTPQEARQALTVLCELYWYPIYVFVRRQGFNADDALDLTQGFFAHFLEQNLIQKVDPEKGRFRSFLLAVCRYF